MQIIKDFLLDKKQPNYVVKPNTTVVYFDEKLNIITQFVKEKTFCFPLIKYDNHNIYKLTGLLESYLDGQTCVVQIFQDEMFNIVGYIGMTLKEMN